MNDSIWGRHNWAVLCLQIVLVVSLSVVARPVEAKPVQFTQPFLMAFNRHDAHVIAFLEHPKYDAVEAFVTNRPGQEPLVRAVLTRLDGFQIDIINDQAIASERAQLLTGRLVVFGEVSYEEQLLPSFAPRALLNFSSPDNETIHMDLSALFPPSPAQGGLTDPGDHALTSSLPVMWRDASTIGSLSSLVLIDGVPAVIAPGPLPGSLSAFYTAGFHIGVVRASGLDLQVVSATTQVRVGRSWTYEDQLGREHRYEIASVLGDLVVIRKTTLQEEIIVARRSGHRKDILEILNVRLTGIPASTGPTPPALTGFSIDLSVPGFFSMGIDHHQNLVTGTTSTTFERHAASWMLAPAQPDWAIPRILRADVAFDHPFGLNVVNTIGTP